MPSRTPYSFTSSSSSSASSSASSSFIPFSNLGLHNRELFSSNFSSNVASSTTVGASGPGGSSALGAPGGSSSRDEFEQVSYTPIYPSYSSSFSNSSLELHESLLLAIRERQQQQLLQLQLQQQQQHQQHQQQHQLQQQQMSSRSTTPPPASASADGSVPTQDHQTAGEAVGDLLELQERLLHEQVAAPTVGELSATLRPLSSSSPIHAAGSNGRSEASDETLDELQLQSTLHSNRAPPSWMSPLSGTSALAMPPSVQGTRRLTPNGFLVPDQAPVRSRALDQEQHVIRDEREHVRALESGQLLLAQPLTIDDSLTELPEMTFAPPGPLPPPSPPGPLPPPSPLLLDPDIDSNSNDHYAFPHGNHDVYVGHSGREDRRSHANDRSLPPEHVSDVQAGPYLTGSHLALSRSLASLQDSLVETSFSNPSSGPQQSVPPAFEPEVASSDTNAESQHASAPLAQTTPDTMYSLADSVLSVLTLVAAPRSALPRRRYTTRDYSSGSVSSDDWLNHPDVVALNNTGTTRTGAADPTFRGNENVSARDEVDTSLDNQENIPPQFPHAPAAAVENTPVNNSAGPTTNAPVGSSFSAMETPRASREPPLQSEASRQPRETFFDEEHIQQQPQEQHEQEQEQEEMRQTLDSLSVDSLSITAAEAIISTALSDVTSRNVDQGSSTSNAQPDDGGIPQQMQGRPAQLADAAQPDRLGLLGPLLSSTQPGPAPNSEGSLDFSLLGSTRQSFDSSILSMASRIRQARLTRLLRLMAEQDTPVGYVERHQSLPIDTRSMVNHASGSRGTSRAGSLEDGLLDLGPEADAFDLNGVEDNRGHIRNREPVQPALFYPVQHPTFAEVLDSNGNPIDCSSSESYASSSTSSVASHETIEERDEDLEWMDTTERRRRQRARRGRPWRHRSFIRGHGRSRVVSTGTVFEGAEHVSETDSLLAENYRYHSLKASWMTNPNGESWSDDDGDDPQRTSSQRNLDVDDKDPETVLMRRGQASLGVLQPSLQHYYYSHGTHGGGLGPGVGSGIGSAGQGSLYYIYGNVRNRYGADSARRRRVLSEMTDLLRREQEWERELMMYNREVNNSRHREGSITAPGQAVSEVGSALGSDPTIETSAGAAVEASGQDDSALESGNLPADEALRPMEGFRDYEQGHSHYQGESSTGHAGRSLPGFSSSSRELLTMPTALNSASPVLAAQPPMNGAISQHQLRRVQNTHTTHLHRQRETEQQQQRYSNGSTRDQDYTHRYSSNTFVPPPSQQQPQSHPNQTMVPMSQRISSSSVAPLSRGNRSSFRTSHDSSGLQYFNLAASHTFALPPSPSSAGSITASALSLPSAPPESEVVDSESAFRSTHAALTTTAIAPTSTRTTTTAATIVSAASPLDQLAGASARLSTASDSSSMATSSTTNYPLSTNSTASSSTVNGMFSSTATSPVLSAASRSSSSLNDTDRRPHQHYPSQQPQALHSAQHPQYQQYQHQHPRQFQWRNRARASNSLYVNYEGGTLLPEERWRRGEEEMIGR
ncbi:hypothetical protein EC968_002581 [Mortierella alpina]|nr:hypothetical protein EC968_002581 [Mortierella alpina]